MDNHTREKASPPGAVAVEAEADVARFDAMLDGGHCLGARQPSGHTLRQAVVDGEGAFAGARAHPAQGAREACAAHPPGRARAAPMATGIPFSRAVACLETRTLCKGAETADTLFYVTDKDLQGATPEDLDERLSTHWRSSESATHWIRDAQYREDFCRMRNPVAIRNRSLLINACAFITNTLRIRKKTSTPALRERFGRRPSLALRLLTNPFDARLDPLKEKAVFLLFPRRIRFIDSWGEISSGIAYDYRPRRWQMRISHSLRRHPFPFTSPARTAPCREFQTDT